MARGSSQSQTTSASSTSPTRPGPVGVIPRGSPAATAGIRCRRLTTGYSSGSAGFSGGGTGGSRGSNILRFYTDDGPGLKITPTVVLIMSVCFIGFVTALHVFGKLYRRSAAGV